MKKDFNEFKEFIKGKRVGVVGIGVSNIPLIHFLVKLEAIVTAFDQKTYCTLGEVASDFEKSGVKLVLGKDYLNDLVGFDVIFKTPSMRMDAPALLKAKEGGTYITSEMEEFVRYCPAKTFGVTGSDGKTTTTTIIYNIYMFNVAIFKSFGDLYEYQVKTNRSIDNKIISYTLECIKGKIEISIK